MVDHIDGYEENGARSNLRWLCRSCNVREGAAMARKGQGRRTVQYNPSGRNPSPGYKGYPTDLLRQLLDNAYPQQVSAAEKRKIAAELYRRDKLPESIAKFYGVKKRVNPRAKTTGPAELRHPKASIRKSKHGYTVTTKDPPMSTGPFATKAAAVAWLAGGGYRRVMRNPSDFEAGADAARMYVRINVRPDRASFLRAFNQWKRAHGKTASLAQFTAGFRSAAPAHWTRNPTKEGGAANLFEYVLAGTQHTRGAHDEGGRIIHNTPKSKRREFAAQIWATRSAGESARGRAYSDEPDWVTNPQKTTLNGAPVTVSLLKGRRGLRIDYKGAGR
jgi:hypothetical protein